MTEDLYTQWLNVPPGPRPPTPRALLGLAPDACEPEVIESAADRQLRRLDQYAAHRDAEKRDTCARLMNEVAQARNQLLRELNVAAPFDAGTSTRPDASETSEAPEPDLSSMMQALAPPRLASVDDDTKPETAPSSTATSDDPLELISDPNTAAGGASGKTQRRRPFRALALLVLGAIVGAGVIVSLEYQWPNWPLASLGLRAASDDPQSTIELREQLDEARQANEMLRAQLEQLEAQLGTASPTESTTQRDSLTLPPIVPAPLRAWGGDDSENAAVSATPEGRFRAIAAGQYHNVAIAADGQLHAWGNDWYDQVSATPEGRFQAVAAGRYHNIAIDMDGQLHAWGADEHGQVSDTPDGAFQAVAAGAFHSIAIDNEGHLHAWGNDEHDQVSETPTGMFRAVAAGYRHNLAIDVNGQLHAWGADEDRQVRGAPNGTFRAIAAGSWHSVAIDTDGRLHAWGNDWHGQVRDKPTGPFLAVDAGSNHNVALDVNGRLHAWGADEHRQVSNIPDGRFQAVAAGSQHGIAIMAER